MTLGESRPTIDSTSSTKPKWKKIAYGLEEAVGYMNPGRKLPSQKEFEIQFSSSRNTVRQALGSLSDRGMIEIKTGRVGGHFVREQKFWDTTATTEKPKNKKQQVAGTLLKRILENEYPPGSRLPSVPELMAEFGFGRNTVRAGVNILEGIVYSKSSSGIFVQDQLPPQEKLDALVTNLSVSVDPEKRLLEPPEPQLPITVSRERHITPPQQVAGKLLERIIAGDYGPGDKIPTDQELMDESGFSRTTVKKGSKLLEGVIYLKPGLGKFVRNPLPPQEQLDMLATNLKVSDPKQKILAPQEPQLLKTILQEATENYYQQVARTLLERIVEGDYGIGDKIPSLMELKAELGFSVVTIRQGIKLLADGGILHTKPGGGIYVNKDSSARSELIQELGLITTTDELINIIKSDNQIVAWRRVTKSARRGLIERMIAEDELNKPILSLNGPDFRGRFNFLGGKSLYGFYENAERDPKREGKTPTLFILESSDLEITTAMIIDSLQAPQRFEYGRIPEHRYKDLLQHAADERKKPIMLLTGHDLNKPFDFLGGKNLRGWLNYANRNKRETQTRISFLLEKAGIPHESGTRRTYRKDQMQKLFTEELYGQTLQENQVTDLLPWIISVSKIYQRRDLNIERHEIENELYIFVNGLFTDTTNSLSSEDMVTKAHQHIEKYISGQSTIGYKEKLLSTKIGDSDLTLGESLGNQEAPLLPAQTIFSRKTETALAKLSPLEKVVVIGITVDELTFDEIANEINQNKEQFQLEAAVDPDMLQEYLEDALLALRSEVDPNLQDDDLEE